MSSREGKLPATVWKMGWISFFADVSSEMAYPILTPFLRLIGAPAFALGLIEGLAEATASLLKGLAGIRSDATGKRLPYVRWGYGLSAAGKPLIGLASVWPMVAFARVLDRYGKGIRTTARDALLADVAPKDRLGAVFGVHRAMDTAGAFVGVLVALGLIALLAGSATPRLGDFRMIFLLAGIPGAVAIVLALSLREPKPESETPAKSKVDLGELWGNVAYRRIVILHAAFAIANTSDQFLLRRAGDQHFSTAAVIGAYLFYNVAYALLSYPAGKLSDKIGRWPLIGAGWLVYAAVYLGFAWMGASWIWPLFLLYGVYISLTQGVAKAQVAEVAPKDKKASALGLFYMVSGVAALAGNFAFGMAWDRWGAATALTAAATLAGLTALSIPFAKQKKTGQPWSGAAG